MSKNIAVMGLQWGDEGKGKVVDLLAADADIIARCQGGANAGHTVIVGDKKYILHLIPSGILHSDKICYIGNGVVLDLFGLLEELEVLRSEGIDYTGRLFISGACNLVLPYHKLLDELYERRRGANSLGTTLRGIGPAYRDKVARSGIRLVDIFSDDVLTAKLAENATLKSEIFDNCGGDPRCDLERIKADIKALRPVFEPMLADISLEVNRRWREGKRILFEGAQGALLDVDLGTYPFATSSNTTIGGVLTGLGIGPRLIDEVVGVVKAYTTRVGAGPFPTELEAEAAERLRQAGGEYGATTGRPRRTGWLDIVALRHACRINGVDKIAVTKLDVLDNIPSLQVCIAYELDGVRLEEFPQDTGALERVNPVYREFPGWMADTSGCGSFQDLPREAREYVGFMAEALQVGIKLVSTGAARAETILVQSV
ncbi:MAG TPA: adenylosuccinate synthase [candidate division Zixibacteria bacterium]|nr:adenylosuccinate synthase [candidate division Zixibacteria bacterium]